MRENNPAWPILWLGFFGGVFIVSIIISVILIIKPAPRCECPAPPAAVVCEIDTTELRVGIEIAVWEVMESMMPRPRPGLEAAE